MMLFVVLVSIPAATAGMMCHDHPLKIKISEIISGWNFADQNGKPYWKPSQYVPRCGLGYESDEEEKAGKYSGLDCYSVDIPSPKLPSLPINRQESPHKRKVYHPTFRCGALLGGALMITSVGLTNQISWIIFWRMDIPPLRTSVIAKNDKWDTIA